MKKLLIILLFVPLLLAAQADEALYQYSTIGALMNGNYDGSISFKELALKGNFGIGTLDNLDGEMIAINGKFYQIDSKGKVSEIPQNIETPFAMVTFFQPEKTVHISDKVSTAKMEDILNDLLEGTNYPVAIEISGEFESIKTRSVPKQRTPYPLLSEAVKQQTLFNYTNIKGILVGFYFPKYFEGINVPGYHFHFISDDRTKGGHVIEYTVNSPKIIPNFCKSINLQLLKSFHNGNALETPNQKELEKIEK